MLVMLVPLGGAKCTAERLRDDTLQVAGTLTDIQYQMVLDNLAMMASNPGLLPWHVRLATGSVEVRDQVSAELGLNSLTWRRVYDLLDARALLIPERRRSQEWNIVPVASPKDLLRLQTAYQQAVGRAAGGPPHPGLDMPPGWFGTGGQGDVPADAAFKGSYRGRHVWVMPGDVQHLSKFTLVVLDIVEPKDSERAFLREVISTSRRPR